MKKKKSFKVLVLSILTIMCTVLAVPGFASADAADGEAAADYFPTVNSASIDFPITLNVEPKSSDTGFFTSENVSDKTPSASILLPVTICIVASILAYVVLRQVKAFRQKNSESLELSSADMPRILLMAKNPALLLAVCFGFGCAVPTFFLQANISRAGAEKVTDLDYETTNFQTYVDKNENPYKIAIDYEYNHSFKESKTDKELVGEAEAAKTDNQPKSERKIEDNGEFIVGSVDVSFTTYNPNGFFADYGMKSGVKCNASDKKENIEKCYAKTNLVNGENKIPSITKEMTKAEFEKLDTAAWGWSDDGETYYPLYWSGSSDEPDNNKNQTIYFAIKLTSNTPAGAYQSSDNFQIYAENNKLTNDMFGKYSITYRNGEENVAPEETQWPLFLKEKPGVLIVTNTIPDAKGECKKFIGWSENNDSSDKKSIKLYQPKENFKVSPEMMEDPDKDGNYVVATLYAIWEETKEGCLTYNVYVDQSFYFVNAVELEDGIDYEKDDDGEPFRKHYCPENVTSDCITEIDIDNEEHKIKDLYNRKARSFQKSTQKKSTTIDLIKDIGIPELRGFEFTGWSLVTTEGNISKIDEYHYQKDGDKEYFTKNEDDKEQNTIELIMEEDETKKDVYLTAQWSLNKPIFEIKYYRDDDTYIGNSTSDGDDSKWVVKDSNPNGVSTIYDFGELPLEIDDTYCRAEGLGNCIWRYYMLLYGLTVDDLFNAKPENGNRAGFSRSVSAFRLPLIRE